MASSKIFCLVAVVGIVNSQPLLKPRLLEDFKVEQTASGLDGPLEDTLPENIKKFPPKFPKKFDPSKDSVLLSKEKVIVKDPAPLESVARDEEGAAEGLFRVPLYRQDFTPPPDQSSDSSLREVAIYSRYPYDEEGFQGTPGDKDFASYSKTIKFITDLLKQKVLQNPPEDKTFEKLEEENSSTKKDVHSIYTSEGEVGTLRLTRNEEKLLSSFKPSSL